MRQFGELRKKLKALNFTLLGMICDAKDTVNFLSKDICLEQTRISNIDTIFKSVIKLPPRFY
jgi:hypothetical protein